MDLTSLNLGEEPTAKAKDAVHEYTPRIPSTADRDDDNLIVLGTGEPYLNGSKGDPQPLVLQIADPSSPTARRNLRKAWIRWPVVKPKGERHTEEEAEQAAINDEGRDRELFARFVVGWNLMHTGADGDEAVDFTVENLAWVFENWPGAAASTILYLKELQDQSGNAESGSAGGPRKKDGSPTGSKTPAKAGGKR